MRQSHLRMVTTMLATHTVANIAHQAANRYPDWLYPQLTASMKMQMVIADLDVIEVMAVLMAVAYVGDLCGIEERI